MLHWVCLTVSWGLCAHIVDFGLKDFAYIYIYIYSSSSANAYVVEFTTNPRSCGVILL